VVPTRIYSGGLFGQKFLSTFQYSVTYAVSKFLDKKAKVKIYFLQKVEAHGDEHVHDSIVFDYDFMATVIEVHPLTM
jgi:hypothetical protein